MPPVPAPPDPLADIRLRLGDAADDIERRALLTAILRAKKHPQAPDVLLGRWVEGGKDSTARLFVWRDTPLGNLVLVLSSRSGWVLTSVEGIEEVAPSCYGVRRPKLPLAAAPLRRFYIPHKHAEARAKAILRSLRPVTLPLRQPLVPKPGLGAAITAALGEVQLFLTAASLQTLPA